MNCPRCGAVQRRETARFCHICGATIELAPTNVQARTPANAAPESASPSAQAPRTVSFTPHGPDEQRLEGKQALPENQPPQQPAGSYPTWLDTAPTALGEQQPAGPHEESRRQRAPAAEPAPAAFPDWAEAAPASGQQQERFSQARPAPSVWPNEPPAWGQQLQPAFPKAEDAPAWRERPLSPPQSSQRNLSQGPFEGRAAPPPSWQSPAMEHSVRPAARGPVSGALHRPRTTRRRRPPLGIIITLSLLLVFVVAGVGIYVFVSSASGPALSAFQTYTDPGHHFTIKYPTVWTVKSLPNGVRFADATNTAELSVTYTPNSSNLTAEQYANQQAEKEGIHTPDTQTFAGTTWVERSGIVTQTSGISQVIYLFVTVTNNLIYEVREVAPLDGYKEPNQAAFMPMLQSLTLS